MINSILEKLFNVKKLELKALAPLLNYEQIMSQENFTLDDLDSLENILDAIHNISIIENYIKKTRQITEHVLAIRPSRKAINHQPNDQPSTTSKPSHRTVIECLVAIPPAKIEAIPLIIEFNGNPSPARIVEAQPEIEQAMIQIETHKPRTQEIIKRCLKLHPIPTRTPPMGF